MNIKKTRINADFDVTIPNDDLYDSDGFDLSELVNRRRKEDADNRTAQAEAQRKAELADKYADVITQIQNSNDKMSTAFNLLVPDSGPADSQAGELVRAMMRIQYRDYNDGDVFYEGYGLETCGAAAQYLINDNIVGDEIFDIAMRTANSQAEGAEYTSLIDEMSDVLIAAILEHPELVTTPNSSDCLYTPLTDIKDLEPKYDLDIEIPYNVTKYIDSHDIDQSDIESIALNWLRDCGCKDGTVEVSYGSVYFYNLDRETYDTLSEEGYDWLESYGNELDDEFGYEE